MLVSGFVSLTLTPMMCSRFVHSEKRSKHGRIYNFFERFFDWMRGGYTAPCKLSCAIAARRCCFAGRFSSLTVVLFVVIPKGFFPDEDTGRIVVTTEASQDISFDAMRNINCGDENRRGGHER